jgi:transcriptional regulator with XRE-family HTH domain
MNTANMISLRKARGLTQDEIARMVGINQRQYSNIERGASFITVDKIEALAGFYNVSADYILGLTKTPSLTGPEAADAALVAELYAALDDRGKTRVKAIAYDELDRVQGRKP